MSLVSFSRWSLLFAVCLFAAEAAAQSASASGSRSSASGSRAVAPGSGSARYGSGSGSRAAETALDGYCAVCILEQRQWVKGSPQFQVDYDGHAYLFPGQEQMAKFQADPAKYAPVLGGDDVVLYGQSGKRSAGSPMHAATLEGRLYLFASEANKRTFSANPRSYDTADLALGGDCVVCQVDMNERRPGSPEVATTHGGVRFFFAGANQMQQFMANTARYAPAASAGSGRKGSGSATRGSGAASGSRTVSPSYGSGSSSR